MSGNFLPVQLVYQGKTTKCLPTVNFSEQWHLVYTLNHLCNEDTMVDYLEKIFLMLKAKEKNMV